MAKFVRNVPTEFDAYQFKYEGTDKQEKYRAGSEEFAEMLYWEEVDESIPDEVKDALLKFDNTAQGTAKVALSVRVNWYPGYGDERIQETFIINEGDWLVADYSVRPRYRVLTNIEFVKLGAWTE